MQLMLISVFGLIGVLSRYGLEQTIKIQHGSFPWSTLMINILGCFLAGFLYVFAEKEIIHPSLQIGLLVGFCGGFTTFSAYAIQTISLFEKAKSGPALVYFLMSPTLGILAAIGAVVMARKIF